MNPNKDAKLRKKWKQNINIIKRDMGDLLTSRMIFNELGEIIKKNTALQKTPGLFFEWIKDNYVARMAVAVRRLADQDKRSISLLNLITELQKNKDALSRKYFLSKYSMADHDMADPDYDSFACKNSKSLSDFKLKSDKIKILKHTKKIKCFVDKWVAHHDYDRSVAIKKLPTFSDLNDTLNQLDEITCKYDMLLTGGGMTSCEPTIQFYWKEPLTIPWINT